MARHKINQINKVEPAEARQYSVSKSEGETRQIEALNLTIVERQSNFFSFVQDMKDKFRSAQKWHSLTAQEREDLDCSAIKIGKVLF